MEENTFDIEAQYADETTRVQPTIPAATARNHAATLTLLGRDPNLEEAYKSNYLSALNSGRGVFETNYKNAEADAKAAYQKPLMNMLGDPSLDLTAKQGAVGAVRDFKFDPVKELSIKAASSEKPTVDSYQAAIIEDTALRMKDEMEYREYEQTMINRTIASLGDVGYKQVFTDMLEQAVPGAATFGSAKLMGDLAKKIGLEPSILLSRNKDAIRERLAQLPIAERKAVFTQIQKTLSENPGLVFKDRNIVEAFANIADVSLSGQYNIGNKLIDDTTQILDALGVGGILKSAYKGFAKVLPKLVKRKVMDTPSPIAPFPVVSNTNPDMGRALYQTGITGDEAAQAVSGTDRTSLILHTEGPQPSVSPNSVEAKLPDPTRKIDPFIKELATQTGGVRYTEEEISAARAATERSFRNASGLTPYPNMASVGVEGDNAVVKGFFGLSDSGFRTPEEALSQSRFAFKDLAIPEEEIKLYTKTPEGTFDLVDPKAVAGTQGEFIIGIDTKIPLIVEDANMGANLTWKLNYFDKFSRLWSRATGSITQNLFDAASVQPSLITGSAELSVNRSSALEKAVIKLGDNFSIAAKKLDKDQQDRLLKVIVESDAQRKHFDDLALKNNFGLNDEAINTLKKWRDAQDTNHWLTNLTWVKKMRNEGYGLLDNGVARLFGKRIEKNQNLVDIYDPVTDTIRSLTKQEMDDLYNRGGLYAKLKTPQNINGTTVSHFIVENNPNSYLRALNDGDQIVNYIPGYYKRYYKAPNFVVKTERNADGQLYERAIAVAPSWKEAEAHLNGAARAAGKTPEEFGRVRSDIKDGIDFEFDTMAEAGIVNQRHRGQLLNNAQSPVHVGGQGMLLDPVESFIRAAANVSNKVAMQDTIDTMKRRLYKQFGDVMPKDGSYPRSPKDIGRIGDMYTDQSRDARSLWQYIDSLEAGFHNSIDEFIKEQFKALSVDAGKAGKTGRESLYGNLSQVSPMTDVSGLVHRSLITWNPLRQWLVQPSQALRLAFYSPTSFIKALDDWKTYSEAVINLKFGNKLNAEQQAMVDLTSRWGALDGVDRNIMVEGPLRDLSRSTNSVLRGAAKADKFVASIGFDPAERMNMVLHMATVLRKRQAEGANIADPRVLDEVFSEAGALTLSLNSAGAMPYNKSALAMFTKFLQIPHKALLQVTGNRRLSRATKAKIAAADTILYGLPMAGIANLLGEDILPDDPKLRDLLEFGFLTNIHNTSFEKLFDVNPKANLSGLAPYDFAGWRELFKGFMESGMVGAFAKSPAGGLLVGPNPRITNAMGKFFDFTTQNGPEGNPVTFMESIKEFAKIAGGYNNFVKYQYILEANKELSRTGVTIDKDVSNLAALHRLFGITTTTEEKMYFALTKMRDDTKNRQEEIRNAVKTAMVGLRERYNQGTDEFDQMLRVHRELNRIFTNPDDFKTATDEYQKLMFDKDTTLYKAMLKYAGFQTKEDIAITIKGSGLPPEEQQKLLKIFVEDFDGLQEEVDKLDKE